ncbi:hypothetical protein [Ralstonia solanacearum]|uniref:Transmembrane protein n=1 Tax=Ralstonia solanacearum TaxID=305 RepID=A0AAD0SC24_RALSL|nr:hypothetical protein CJO77_19640 [Ralstonia solanacearum]AXW54916.1 hypothetical protein CJO92_19645 [Ralstonia solanacearum]CBJ35017.1 hypothethical protein [Ralstonia solanacearum PSI07]
MGLGDKAIGFVEAFHKISESDTLRKLAWPANVATLMAVSSMRTVQGLPLLQIEVKFVRALALTGVTTMGTAAQKYVEKVALSKKAEAAERARMRKATGALQAAARAKSSGALESGGARNARAAGLGAMLDVFAAVIKGYQLGVKNDGRSAGELVQQTLQGVGNLLDWRAKAYEEAIFNGVNASEFYRAKAMTTSFDGLRMENLLILRKTAFKVLLPAAVISMAFDIWDAKKSDARGDIGVRNAQIASVVGTALAIAGIGVAAFNVGLFGFSAAGIAAVLGFVGAVLTFGSVLVLGGLAWLGISGIQDEPWVNWLKDCPLARNKEDPNGLQREKHPPVHANLLDTLQNLSNAKAAL